MIVRVLFIFVLLISVAEAKFYLKAKDGDVDINIYINKDNYNKTIEKDSKLDINCSTIKKIVLNAKSKNAKLVIYKDNKEIYTMSKNKNIFEFPNKSCKDVKVGFFKRAYNWLVNVNEFFDIATGSRGYETEKEVPYVHKNLILNKNHKGDYEIFFDPRFGDLPYKLELKNRGKTVKKIEFSNIEADYVKFVIKKDDIKKATNYQISNKNGDIFLDGEVELK